MATIVFDFDKVLSEDIVQRFARKMINGGNDIWVCTARRGNDFNKQELAKSLKSAGITEHQVIYCNGKAKWEILKGINADIYIDNIEDEFSDIKSRTNCIPLLYS